MTENEISKIVVNCAFKVHKELGPGLMESVYQKCLTYELIKSGLNIETEKTMAVNYYDVVLDSGYRLDIWIDKKVIIELKAVEYLNEVHLAQILTYLKLTDNKLGLLINFNVAKIKNGIKRVVNGVIE
mgnify:CR=1 FL=1